MGSATTTDDEFIQIIRTLGPSKAQKILGTTERNIYASFIRDPVGIRNRDLPGGKNIMWSTDYPHSETTWPESRKVMDWQFAGVSEQDMRPIVYGNARRFYGLA